MDRPTKKGLTGYRVEARAVWDSESDDGQTTVYDVIDPTGELVYTGCDWATAEPYAKGR